jgi:hypothetical protein
MNNFIPDFLEVLTAEGWIPLNQYNKECPVLLLNRNYRTGLLKPKAYSITHYKGQLIEFETDSCKVYAKPSSAFLCNDLPTKAKDAKKGDLLNRRYMWHRIEHVERGDWEGNLTSLFFGEDLYLPLKFEFDYWLHIV